MDNLKIGKTGKVCCCQQLYLCISFAKQLLSFARTLVYNPDILILDEATSNIDTETEQLIQDALFKLTKNRTSIAIAHRLSTIQHSDKIIVLKDGRINEVGNHQELLEKQGLYYNLYKLQYKDQLSKIIVDNNNTIFESDI